MKLQLLIIALVLSTPIPPNPPNPKPHRKFVAPLKGGQTLMALAKSKALVPAPPRSSRPLPFKYPTNASNYFWDIQTSTSLRGPWITLATNLVWPPSTNGDWTILSTNPASFYRMKGHSTWTK
jgi:hypothetical protein